jgi:cation:H+ antiporter
VFFVCWRQTVEARRRRSAARTGVNGPSGRVIGSAPRYAVAAGRLIVFGAKGVATPRPDPFVGATLVAIGTSVPELATTIVARLRGHHEVALGTILGSNIFNGFFIVAVAAIIHPIEIAWRAVAVALGFGVLVILFAIPGLGGLIPRRRGLALLTLYVAYVVTVLQVGIPTGALE